MELAAFRTAALEMVLDLAVAERAAALLVYGDGDGDGWRERVAAIIPIGWGQVTGEIARQPGVGPVDRADRPTGEGE